jgi:hypothetical protein
VVADYKAVLARPGVRVMKSSDGKVMVAVPIDGKEVTFTPSQTLLDRVK